MKAFRPLRVATCIAFLCRSCATARQPQHAWESRFRQRPNLEGISLTMTIAAIAVALLLGMVRAADANPKATTNKPSGFGDPVTAESGAADIRPAAATQDRVVIPSEIVQGSEVTSPELSVTHPSYV